MQKGRFLNVLDTKNIYKKKLATIGEKRERRSPRPVGFFTSRVNKLGDFSAIGLLLEVQRDFFEMR
jgi:hypothetical protein